MGLQDGDNQNPDWLDRWSDKLRIAVQTYGPPTRDWIKRRLSVCSKVLSEWHGLSPMHKGISVGVGCVALLLIVWAFRISANSDVEVKGDNLEFYYYTTSSPVLGDVNWAETESRKIAQLVWQYAHKYPKQKGFIRVAVRNGGKYPIFNDAPSKSHRRRMVESGGAICLIEDDLLKVRIFKDADSFTYQAYEGYALVFLYLPYSRPPQRLHWRNVE